MLKPIDLFSSWYSEEQKLSKREIPSAVCLSTIGTDGFPNARFVSLKEVRNNTFIVTGPLDSKKGIEIGANPNVALTFWWTETNRQVRIQGIAKYITDDLAEQYFNDRSRASKAVSRLSKQGEEIADLKTLENDIQSLISDSSEIERPMYWSGFSIQPIRIEFMQFETSRFHKRTLYEYLDGEWHSKLIQP
ncbi:MAG: pyridoxamine 5'-phosphate oxidase [Winogradskyella sp.]|uniref:pyridoxine/pyridoxamine 5'-phosphate oxidase n=1 Tax=Winogradskyella sp. TaxID=1883156 RepID=UPI000F3FBD09|nr:pyridoxal 5'-phosphate synthase [Winogradskyella sp.]RNC86245.1 MAG: pyridoxamine 5'-phosphate oxidase [Winogradskyella sp.]